ncbi:hypothetical protein Bhyg_14260 [Pseudolycoriella hygida]|uniref:Uncharacterized protein n=1 Tax=Pseudolycoriella hygida TaxID=35572 RepID=A0A9Q0MRM6_9DIPT|nr:hypothetical protein Bhyg_14260 [Pseudolycoriella hygida]
MNCRIKLMSSTRFRRDTSNLFKEQRSVRLSVLEYFREELSAINSKINDYNGHIRYRSITEIKAIISVVKMKDILSDFYFKGVQHAIKKTKNFDLLKLKAMWMLSALWDLANEIIDVTTRGLPYVCEMTCSSSSSDD